MIRTLHYLKAMGYDFTDENLKLHSKIENFKDLRKNIQECTLCHFSKSRCFTLMENEIKNASLVIVDTLAHKNENEKGVLLNSKKGERLKFYLKEILGLCEKEFYFSYLFKCFSNGKFDDFSLQSCLPFFWNELELVQPKMILCLGEYPFKSLGFSDFNALRGEIFAYKNFFIMASFELEFIEKNPSCEKIFIQDLKKIKGFL
ncbi:uracil-DNA glycosylase family protein [Campylobacter coli]|uniref:uracil-DNA glycosylase family protein n=1 Tax=Campylobacter coli TaxID=195 RepID=UPI0009315F32|nr:uracil-DNA glycosylase family protein [Campylobacter coli]EHV3220838.1 uracil-DNA glycosylase family protein [Campylobacter coli]